MSESAAVPATTSATLTIPGDQSMVALLGPGDRLLDLVAATLDAGIHVRGNTITITGAPEAVDEAMSALAELRDVLASGQSLDEPTVRQVLRMVTDTNPDSDLKAAAVLSEALLTHRGKTIRPKTLGQKRYLDAIRSNTVTFGIGPAGTGKTYLAMAMAVQALRARQVNRLILTRPAVEAGERLGFLPGTLHEKIDPYLKPLWDALRDMMDTEELVDHVDSGTIEVAPLAYMRGRAQPASTLVATPTGFRPIGEIRVGDDVVGSDGRPTKVTGVFPQGKREVFRVTAQDGASTRCCGEHLWSVWTRSDRRRGKGPRTLQTREMVGRLRTSHYRTYELPMVDPVAFESMPVPMDPYALGLMLGDGCMTGSTTPSFATDDAELAQRLDDALAGVSIRHRGGPDYVLNRSGGGRGGVIVENPVTAVFRELGLWGANSATKFVPQCYLDNDVETRLAVLQGLLDVDGGPVTQRGRTCRVHYTSVSDRLRDDVVRLVRSLGGVAYARTRVAAGRRFGMARGREVHHRHDAHTVDIRLPQALDPFRLTRKIETYRAHGAGVPMRRIESIIPEGEAETVCIRVAAPDSLYVTEDFLVTHNTLNDAFIVLDEAQNTTPEQMKMFLTRIGFNSKAVVTGDISQTDLPGGTRSGLRVVRDILDDIDGIAFARLTAGDVVRHHIVQRIVEAYERHDEQREAAQAEGRDDRRSGPA